MEKFYSHFHILVLPRMHQRQRKANRIKAWMKLFPRFTFMHTLPMCLDKRKWKKFFSAKRSPFN